MSRKPPHSVQPGERFGRLTAVVKTDERRSGRVVWLCRCDCGTEKLIAAGYMTCGKTVSCGCYAREMNLKKNPYDPKYRTITHGMHDTPEYKVWTSMKDRCGNPRSLGWKHYGARGIRVCERWSESFTAFIEDVGRRPSSEHSIDRFPDNDGNYEPGNVRWATVTQQARNMSVTKLCSVSVCLIRHMRRRGTRVVDLAWAFGVAPQTICSATKNRSWREVQP